MVPSGTVGDFMLYLKDEIQIKISSRRRGVATFPNVLQCFVSVNDRALTTSELSEVTSLALGMLFAVFWQCLRTSR